jgi:hypothetical protein
VWGYLQRSQARAQLTEEGWGGREAVRWCRAGSSGTWIPAWAAIRCYYGCTDEVTRIQKGAPAKKVPGKCHGVRSDPAPMRRRMCDAVVQRQVLACPPRLRERCLLAPMMQASAPLSCRRLERQATASFALVHLARARVVEQAHPINIQGHGHTMLRHGIEAVHRAPAECAHKWKARSAPVNLKPKRHVDEHNFRRILGESCSVAAFSRMHSANSVRHVRAGVCKL